MDNFPHFLWAVFYEWLVNMSGPLSVIAAAWKQYKESRAIQAGSPRHPKEVKVFWGLAIVCTILAFFSVWQKEFVGRQNAEGALLTEKQEVRLRQRRIDRIHDDFLTASNKWLAQKCVRFSGFWVFIV
jgi:hypothetical protein